MIDDGRFPIHGRRLRAGMLDVARRRLAARCSDRRERVILSAVTPF